MPLKSQLALAAILLFAAIAPAQVSELPEPAPAPPSNLRPPGLKDVAIWQHRIDQIPADLIFRDETGKTVRLGDYYGKKPLILNLVYYRCPMLCGEVLTGLTSALKVLTFDVGKQFDVLTVSFDARETPEI